MDNILVTQMDYSLINDLPLILLFEKKYRGKLPLNRSHGFWWWKETSKKWHEFKKETTAVHKMETKTDSEDIDR